MAFFSRNKAKADPGKILHDLITHNADLIEKKEGKSRAEAEYLAICLIIDDLKTKPKGGEGMQQMMRLLQEKFPHHLNDVVTYIAWSTGKIHLKPEAEEELRKRHA